MGVSSDAIVFYGYVWDVEDVQRKGNLKEGDSVTWGWHCSDAAPMRYLAIEESEVTAWRGYPVPLPSTATPLQWEDVLNEELERHGVEPPEGENQPGWWIVSWMG
jgi:hypothetical protein